MTDEKKLKVLYARAEELFRSKGFNVAAATEFDSYGQQGRTYYSLHWRQSAASVPTGGGSEPRDYSLCIKFQAVGDIAAVANGVWDHWADTSVDHLAGAAYLLKTLYDLCETKTAERRDKQLQQESSVKHAVGVMETVLDSLEGWETITHIAGGSTAVTAYSGDDQHWLTDVHSDHDHLVLIKAGWSHDPESGFFSKSSAPPSQVQTAALKKVCDKYDDAMTNREHGWMAASQFITEVKLVLGLPAWTPPS
jgi:hypothetical protein